MPSSYLKKAEYLIRDTQGIDVDTGYTGILKMYAGNKNILIPKKSSKKRPLMLEEKLNNKFISRETIAVENVIGFIKRFRIISERYRCRRKRFAFWFKI